ncbi:metallophosphoesterase family protein [Neorhodopirellula lusitana]|uniref:metallophosphoesterase family protein n=1 Tax=Neorhodopirellula lusitana TaxID=445327 RepID=UPI00384CC3B0
MNVLCFSDLHCDQAAATLLVEQARTADLVIGAGDFANRHQGISDTLDILRQIEAPSILVPGNGETAEELKQAVQDATWKSATVLHGNGTTVSASTDDDATEYPVWGVGGGIPITPFGAWSYDFDEQQGEAMLADCPHNGILVVHSPPIDTVDHDSAGKVRGSQSILDCVKRCQPKLVVCGHIHSDWGKQMKVGPTTILNAGPKGIWMTL